MSINPPPGTYGPPSDPELEQFHDPQLVQQGIPPRAPPDEPPWMARLVARFDRFEERLESLEAASQASQSGSRPASRQSVSDPLDPLADRLRRQRFSSPMQDIRHLSPPTQGQYQGQSRQFGSSFFRPMGVPPPPPPTFVRSNPLNPYPSTNNRGQPFNPQNQYRPPSQLNPHGYLHPNPPPNLHPNPPPNQPPFNQGIPPQPPLPPGAPPMHNEISAQSAMTPQPSEIKERRPPPGVKVQSFRGTFGEDVEGWIKQMNVYFFFCGTPTELKTPAAFLFLEGEARIFMSNAIDQEDAGRWTWEYFCERFRYKYSELLNDTETLRDKLETIRFRGNEHMVEYCEAFSKVASRIHDMSFTDLYRTFLRQLPAQCAMLIRNHLKNIGDLRQVRMDDIYNFARMWASTALATFNHQHPNNHHGRQKTVLKGKLKPLRLVQQVTSSPATTSIPTNTPMLFPQVSIRRRQTQSHSQRCSRIRSEARRFT